MVGAPHRPITVNSVTCFVRHLPLAHLARADLRLLGAGDVEVLPSLGRLLDHRRGRLVLGLAPTNVAGVGLLLVLGRQYTVGLLPSRILSLPEVAGLYDESSAG